MPPICADACDARHIEIEAVVRAGGGVGAIARASQAANGLATAGFLIEQATCNPRDPLSACAREPEFGSPAGDIYVVEDSF
jgi:hypothetical protein